MTATDWTRRINPRNLPPDLQDLRHAGHDLGQEAHHFRGRTGVVFQQVSQCVILTSVLATASLAFFHLWKGLCRDYDKGHRDHSPTHDSDAESDSPRRHTRDIGDHARR